mgnify:CR=1 FL=1
MIVLSDFMLLAKFEINNNEDVDFKEIAEELNKKCGSLFEKRLSCADIADLYSEGFLKIIGNEIALIAQRY